MAEENTTIANITPAFFEKYIMSVTLPSGYVENGKEPTLVQGPSQNWKVWHSDSSDFSVVEVRPPYVRKVPNETPMIIDWVDSGMVPVVIEFQNGARIEALKLTPNPDSLVISSSKIINRYNTMTRWVEEHWGDDIDSINFSGSTYSFNARVTDGNYSGLTSIYRNSSEAYEFLKRLMDIYRTNGYLYQEDNGYTIATSSDPNINQYEYESVNRFLLQNPSFKDHHPRRGMIRERLYNRISFDYVTFLGYFESFDVTEDSSSPFKLVYNTIFKAEKTIWTVG